MLSNKMAGEEESDVSMFGKTNVVQRNMREEDEDSDDMHAVTNSPTKKRKKRKSKKGAKSAGSSLYVAF